MSYKIAYIIDSLGGGGAERQLVSLAENLPPNYHPEIISLSKKGFVMPEFKNAGVPVHRFGMDNLFIDMAMEDDKAHVLFDKITY